MSNSNRRRHPVIPRLADVRSVRLVSGFVFLAAAPTTAQEPTLVVENARVIVGDGTV